MACGAERHLGGPEGGPRAAVRIREDGRRTERVHGGEAVLERGERRGVLAHERRHLGTHPPLLRLLVLGGQQQAVVQLDGEERLDEHRLARAGAVLDDARDGAGGRDPDRHDEATVAHGDVVLGHRVGHVGVAHQTEETGLELDPQLAHDRARRGERRARVVPHLAALVERAGERRLHLGGQRQRLGERGERGEAGRVAPEPGPDLTPDADDLRDLGQAPRLQGGALGGRCRQGRCQQRDVGRRRPPRLAPERRGFFQQREPPLGLGRLGRRVK